MRRDAKPRYNISPSPLGNTSADSVCPIAANSVRLSEQSYVPAFGAAAAVVLYVYAKYDNNITWYI